MIYVVTLFVHLRVYKKFCSIFYLSSLKLLVTYVEIGRVRDIADPVDLETTDAVANTRLNWIRCTVSCN